MALKVSWSTEAIENLEEIVDYLEKNWSENEIKKFFIKLEKVIDLISQNPKLFKTSITQKNIRRCVLSK
ncbi:MAG: type II toxin-antitoxin system RelE/ParE family toxin [Bacteroidia bacterium]|jgi:plasmid stabilization system protein ParE